MDIDSDIDNAELTNNGRADDALISGDASISSIIGSL